jgi:hypothetical protein
MVHVILKQLKKNEELILSENLKQSVDGMMVESQMQQYDHDHLPTWT